MWIVFVVLYLLIGGVIHAILDDEEDELTGVIFCWPLMIILYGVVYGTEACKAFGRFVVNLFNHFIYEGEQNEKENN